MLKSSEAPLSLVQIVKVWSFSGWNIWMRASDWVQWYEEASRVHILLLTACDSSSIVLALNKLGRPEVKTFEVDWTKQMKSAAPPAAYMLSSIMVTESTVMCVITAHNVWAQRGWSEWFCPAPGCTVLCFSPGTRVQLDNAATCLSGCCLNGKYLLYV